MKKCFLDIQLASVWDGTNLANSTRPKICVPRPTSISELSGKRRTPAFVGTAAVSAPQVSQNRASGGFCCPHFGHVHPPAAGDCVCGGLEVMLHPQLGQNDSPGGTVAPQPGSGQILNPHHHAILSMLIVILIRTFYRTQLSVCCWFDTLGKWRRFRRGVMSRIACRTLLLAWYVIRSLDRQLRVAAQ